MPIRHTYRPGSFLRVDDRTGFICYAENTRKQWNNIIVGERVWEPRQPQDFVRGVYDPQTVPEPRPIPTYQFIPNAETQLAQTASPFVFDSNGYMVRDSSGSPIETGSTGIGYVLDSAGDPVLDSSGAPIIDTSDAAWISVLLANGWQVGDSIWIMRDSGDWWTATIISIDGADIQYIPGIAFTASSGNVVLNITAQIRMYS